MENPLPVEVLLSLSDMFFKDFLRTGVSSRAMRSFTYGVYTFSAGASDVNSAVAAVSSC